MKNMKYKVLAADDEFWSRENIRNLIPWEEYSLEFLEPACDGEEVIERIAEEKPDIILTDINMPFLSGLELLQRLQNEYPEIITIAISGYDDFDKVKGVFVSGGLDYLLKPVDADDLVGAVEKLKNKLGKKNTSENLELLLQNFNNFKQKNKKITIHTMHGFEVIAAQDILYCKSDVNYTTLFLKDEKMLTVARTLKEFEAVLTQYNFYRIRIYDF